MKKVTRKQLNELGGMIHGVGEVPTKFLFVAYNSSYSSDHSGGYLCNNCKTGFSRSFLLYGGKVDDKQYYCLFHCPAIQNEGLQKKLRDLE